MVCCFAFKPYTFNVGLPHKILTCLFCFDRMQRKVLHQFVMMAKRQMPTRIGDHTDAEDKAAQEGSKRLSQLFLIMSAKKLYYIDLRTDIYYSLTTDMLPTADLKVVLLVHQASVD